MKDGTAKDDCRFYEHNQFSKLISDVSMMILGFKDFNSGNLGIYFENDDFIKSANTGHIFRRICRHGE